MLYYFEFRRQSCLPKKHRLVELRPKQEREKASLRSETDERREARLESDGIRNAETRSSESVKRREKRLKTDRVRTANTHCPCKTYTAR